MDTKVEEPAHAPLFDASKRKKKKKPKRSVTGGTVPVTVKEAPTSVPTPTSVAGPTEKTGDTDATLKDDLLEVVDDGSFDPPATTGDEGGVVDEEEMDFTSMPTLPTSGLVLSASGDYGYEQLLKRAFDLIGQTKSDKPRIKIPPPQAFRIGTSRTLWANFPQISKALHRNPQHLLNFVIVELGTTANLDGNGRLVIRGRFMPKDLESLVRKYLVEYVVCKTCGSRDTTLKKENRLHFLECLSSVCGSTRSVPPLNKGYVHNIRRKK